MFSKPQRWMYNDCDPGAYGRALKLQAAYARSSRESARSQKQYERMIASRQREARRQARLQDKLAALRQANLAVKSYEQWVERITSVHQECGRTWDWAEVASAEPPLEPIRSTEKEDAARQQCEAYSAGWFDRLFRRVEGRRAALAAAVDAARTADSAAYKRACQEHADTLEDHKAMKDLGRRILEKDSAAYRDAIDWLRPFKEVDGVGSQLEFSFPTENAVAASFTVGDTTVIPTEVTSRLESGRVSVKKMPTGKGNELYQDYVAGAAFRIARETFALLPIETVLVTAVRAELDTSTGRVADTPILSAVFDRDTTNRLDFEEIDPSDALRNFRHRMSFTKRKGMSPIEPLGLPETGSR